MKECINCKAKNRNTDIYCRNCGWRMRSDKYYILINIMIILLIIGITCLLALFVASYIIKGE